MLVQRTDLARYIYSFIEGQPEELIATIPYAPYYITSIKAFDNYIYACINYEFRILKIDISTGGYTVFYEAPSGTFYPSDIEGINLSSFPDPTASSVAATEVAITSATLNGIVNANDISTTVTFEYWTENSEISSSPATPSPVTGADNTVVSADITGLDAGTTYYFRVKAESIQGIAYSDVFTFTTYKTDAITDIDGNYYNIVTIGDQTWMAENLKTTRYNDGTEIPLVTDKGAWENLATPGYCWYNNDQATFGNTYGALYNWYVVDAASNGGKNVCPTGWHVATDAEWSTLASFVDPTLSVSGGMLKEAGTTHWDSPNTGATNESGFAALPGGFRNNYGQFSENGNIGNIGYWWTSTESSSGYAYIRGMDYMTPYVSTAGLLTVFGNSVRCIKEAATTCPVITGTLTGPETVCPDTPDPALTFTGYGGTPPYTFSYSVNDSAPLTVITPENSSSYVLPISKGTIGVFDYALWSVTDANECSTVSPEPPYQEISIIIVGTTAFTDPATVITPESAILNGSVNPEGTLTEISFEYGLSESYGSIVAATPASVNGTEETAVSATLSELTENTIYHYRIVAVCLGCTVYGEDMTFTTYKSDAITDIDGNYYNIVTIGSQTWMAENLKTTEFNDGTPIPNVTNNDEWCVLSTPGYRWYEDDANSYKDTYGALYNWYTGSGSGGKNVCPTDWHVPTDADWIKLTTYLGESNAGGKLKATGTIEGGDGLWQSPNTGATNETGFSALPGGFIDVYFNSGDPQPHARFITMGGFGYFWTSTEGRSRLLRYDAGNVQVTGIFGLHCGLSIRCVKNIEVPMITTTEITSITQTTASGGGNIRTDIMSPVTARGVCWSSDPSPTVDLVTKTNDGTGTGAFVSSIAGLTAGITYYVRAYFTMYYEHAVTVYGEEITFTTYNADAIADFDGNYYNIVKIGTQNWLGENLKVTHLANGDPVPNVTDNTQWGNLTTPGLSWYNHDEAAFKDPYGALYNWFAVNQGNLCPVGWYVPTMADWDIMRDLLGGAAKAGGELKETGTMHWLAPNEGATNSSGFTGMPGGYRGPDGTMRDLSIQGMFWTSTDGGEDHAYTKHLFNHNTELFLGWDEYKDGISVRCINDQLMVTNVNDAGIGSLRNAIEYANSTVGIMDTITFNITTGTAPFTIEPETQLPAITDPVVIDGYTQPGAMPATDSKPATILIEIDGNALGSAAGLNLDAGNSTISGLSISNFRVSMTIGGDGNNTIKGNYFTGKEGTVNNIHINSANNVIGGRTPAARNVITLAGAGDGIEINNANGHLVGQNRIIGNYIGIDPTGEIKRGNDFAGISIVESPGNIIGGPDEGERNVISGNITGIFISGFDATGNRIEGNYIGTNAGGTKAIGNDTGISVSAPGNFIGGSTQGTGNLISGNGGPGGGYTIKMNWAANGNIIQGNMIGTDRTGLNAIPNTLGSVINIEGGDNNLIGGLIQGARNIISGNWENAIQIELDVEDVAEGNRIQGNYIGTDISGKGALGNGGAGIKLGNATNNNIVGGNEPGATNIIAFNEGVGVIVDGTAIPGTGNAILTNSIHSNGELGIDLVGGTEDDFGVTENNAENEGPNNLQHYPVIESITYSRGVVNIIGSLTSAATTTYTIQFFTSKIVDESGYGEGQVYLGSATVITDTYGIASFLKLSPEVLQPRYSQLLQRTRKVTPLSFQWLLAALQARNYLQVNSVTRSMEPVFLMYLRLA